MGVTFGAQSAGSAKWRRGDSSRANPSRRGGQGLGIRSLVGVKGAYNIMYSSPKVFCKEQIISLEI